MKPQRQKLIIDILRRRPIANQEELVLELARQGVRTNQATVSRDIKALGLLKVPDSTVGHRYALPDSPRPKADWDTVASTFREHVSRIDRSDALIVLRTPPAGAHMVGLVLDLLDTSDIVGTVAGDDTVIVVPRSVAIMKRLMERFNLAWHAPEGPR